MHSKLTRLVLFTCLAFLGIISLQVYWLYNSYLEKETKLESDISASLLTNQLLYVMKNRPIPSKVLPKSNTIAVKLPLKERIRIDTSINGSDTSINLVLSQAKNGSTERTIVNLVSTVQATDTALPFPIQKYKNELSESLKKRGIQIPFEVALVCRDGSIVSSSIDSVAFRQIPFKTRTANAPDISLLNGKTARAQIAIPHVRHFIIKKLLPIALISTLFIIFCIVSLAYMISLFYKHKKISEIRNDFTNNMTHELKTPISSVTVALGLLKDDSMGLTLEQKKDYFQIAENELQRLVLLVDKVLKMAAFEKGEIRLRPQIFPIKPWIESIVNPLRPMLSTMNAKVSITVYPETLKIKADKANLSSVLQNLLDNAIKYADREKDRLSIQIDAWQGDDDYFLAVQDNGIGIPFYHQEQIFDKFFRVPTGDEHETKGYGLGLSYVKEIVQLHGGNIEVDSTFHIGTRFKIRIPKKQA
ncbi:MAG TPA: HAMP domain-containing sensor histidine kinase [Edaphocola sp.]|nr:HAMP domain-containing sensor histidine kinase [Edaphocola sp.]